VFTPRIKSGAGRGSLQGPQESRSSSHGLTNGPTVAETAKRDERICLDGSVTLMKLISWTTELMIAPVVAAVGKRSNSVRQNTFAVMEKELYVRTAPPFGPPETEKRII